MKNEPSIFSAKHQDAYESLLRGENGIRNRKEIIRKQMGLTLPGAWILTALNVVMLIWGTHEGLILNLLVTMSMWAGYQQQSLELKSLIHLEIALEKKTTLSEADNPLVNSKDQL